MRARATTLERNHAGRLAWRLTEPYVTIFAGDCAGTALCTWISKLLPGGTQTWACAVPWTTPAVNLAGAFLLGLLAGLLTRRFPRADPRVRLPLGTGFLGSFTTYGTFATGIETTTMAQAAVYVAGSIACGPLCAWDGLSLGTCTGRGNAKQRSAGRRDQLADRPEPEASV